MDKLYHYIKKCAESVGFDLCGVVRGDSCTAEREYVDGWIERGYSGTMEWMSTNQDLRESPSLLVPGAKSVVVCGLSYLSFDRVDRVSKYALGMDYHYIIKSMLQEMADMLTEHLGREFNYRLFSDSAPIYERYWARCAGLGWIGRNHMLINREYGSYTLLGELISDLEFDAYDSEDSFNGCGECHRCENACPGGALCSGGLDSRRCASYLTIEHSGDFSPEQSEAVARGGYLFGCDICQDVCPWNRGAVGRLAEERAQKVVDLFSIDQSKTPLTLEQWQEVLEQGFKQIFKGRPMLRAGKRKIARNLASLEKSSLFEGN